MTKTVHTNLEDTEKTGNKTSICGKEYSLFTVFFSYNIHGRTDQDRIKEYCIVAWNHNKVSFILSIAIFVLSHCKQQLLGYKHPTCIPLFYRLISKTSWRLCWFKYCAQCSTIYVLKLQEEAAWSSGLGRWIWNLEVPGSNLPPYHYLDLFSVVPSSTPRPRCVNSQLVSLPPVGILILCYIYNICLCIYSVPN